MMDCKILKKEFGKPRIEDGQGLSPFVAVWNITVQQAINKLKSKSSYIVQKYPHSEMYVIGLKATNQRIGELFNRKGVKLSEGITRDECAFLKS